LSDSETIEVIEQLAEMGLEIETLENENKSEIFAFLFGVTFNNVAKDQEYQKHLDLHHRPRGGIDWTWRQDIQNILWKINQLKEGLS
jgi:hypothetical protein